MKKLMIGVFAIAFGLVANAASYQWNISSGKIAAGTNDKTMLASGTAYLINGSVTSQQALLDAFLADGFAMNTYALTGSGASISAGTLSPSSAFDVGVTSSFSAYYAIVNGDNIYISETTASGYQESATQLITFSTSPSKTSNALPVDTGTFGGAGWYTAVPEPTSGLLMLLGMAGLALRRRRA